MRDRIHISLVSSNVQLELSRLRGGFDIVHAKECRCLDSVSLDLTLPHE